LWKDGTYFPRGTRVVVVGLHLDQGFCVRFPAEVDGEPLETWEDWGESDFLAADGTVEHPSALSATVLAEAREVLDEAEDGCHLHLHETDD
jgi:cytosine/adenosine deaminase-related metal-dependent hydrolase